MKRASNSRETLRMLLVARDDWTRPFDLAEKNWNDERWAWEFLRRSAAYEHDYRKWKSVLAPRYPDMEDSWTGRQLTLAWGVECPVDPVKNEPPRFRLPDSTVSRQLVPSEVYLPRWRLEVGLPTTTSLDKARDQLFESLLRKEDLRIEKRIRATLQEVSSELAELARDGHEEDKCAELSEFERMLALRLDGLSVDEIRRQDSETRSAGLETVREELYEEVAKRYQVDMESIRGDVESEIAKIETDALTDPPSGISHSRSPVFDLSPFEVAFTFDLRYPLEKQFALAIERAKEIETEIGERGLLAERKRRRRESAEILARYTRIFDAWASGMTAKAIESGAHPSLSIDLDAIRNCRRRLGLVLEKGYINLLRKWST